MTAPRSEPFTSGREPYDRAAVAREVARYRLQPPRRLRGTAGGEHGAQGTGSSIEFQELREYRPGDDIRHLDWRASLRTDRWMLRLYHEEVQHRVLFLVDASRSMSVETVKAIRLRELASFLLRSAAASGFRPLAYWAADELRREDDAEAADHIPLEGHLDLSAMLRRAPLPTAGRAWRIVISDFLFEHDPGTLIARVAPQGSPLTFLQLLTAEERQPSWRGLHRLIDVESGEERITAVDERETARYRERLRSWNEAIARACHAHGAQYLELEADRTLAELAQQVLLPAGLLLPRGGER